MFHNPYMVELHKSIGDCRSEALLKEIYAEVLDIRKELDMLEEIIIPEELISQEERKELKKLRKESLKGENVRWDEIKKELLS